MFNIYDLEREELKENFKQKVCIKYWENLKLACAMIFLFLRGEREIKRSNSIRRVLKMIQHAKRKGVIQRMQQFLPPFESCDQNERGAFFGASVCSRG